MISLEIRLFGAIEIRRDGKTITDFRSQKALVLLAYLICEDRPVTRDFLAGLSWPDTAQSQALGLLRRTLHDLNQRLPGCLDMDRRTVCFRPTVATSVDVHQFAALLAQDEVSAWEQAAALHRAPFLHGVYVDDAPELERWLLQEQERWRHRMMETLTRLVEHYTQEAAYAQALGFARRMLALEPWREEAHRQTMLLLARTGQTTAALAQYTACRRALWDELGVEPSLETESLCARIRTMSTKKAHNLPPPLTPFVGRQEARQQLQRLLSNRQNRLITVVGPGGIGKTRLAQETVRAVAGQEARMFLHGAVYVPLAGVDTTQQLLSALGQALALTFQPASDPATQLLEHLRDKEMLLLFDNFEHLITSDSLAFLGQILEHAPEVTLLVTSRARLRLHGEQLYWVHGLHFPDVTHNRVTLTLAEALTYEGIQLIVGAAQRIHADYAPTPDEIQALAAICRQVHGAPLALELAMGWSDRLKPAEITAELAHNLDLLAHDASNLPVGHRSMRAVFHTSWRLLNAGEQQVFPALSVFRGGFTEAMAASVAMATPTILAGLVEKSLLQQSPEGRYDLHEMTRHFAAEQLEHQGRTHTLQLGHAHAILDYLGRWDAATRQTYNQDWLQAVMVEYDNVQAALHWCLAGGAPQIGLELMATLGDFWHQQGQWQIGRGWLERALAHASPEESPVLRAALLNHLGVLLYVMDEDEAARRMHEESLQIYRTLNDEGALALTFYHLACVSLHGGDYAKTKSLAAESVRLFRRQGDLRRTAHALARLATLLFNEGQDLAQAELLLLESLALARQSSAASAISGALILLGVIAEQKGDLAQAEQYLQESLILPMSKAGESWALGKLGKVLLSRGDVAAAADCFQRALALRQELGSLEGVAWMLEAQADVAIASGMLSQAAQLLATVHTLRSTIQVHLGAVEGRQYDEKIAFVRSQLAPETFNTAWRTGSRLAGEQSDFTTLFQPQFAPSPSFSP